MRIPLPLRLCAVIAALPSFLSISHAALSQSEPVSRSEEESGPGALPDLEVLLDAWRETHGPEWRLAVDWDTGYAQMIYGGSAQPSVAPRSESDWEAAARTFLADTQEMHGLAGVTLVHERSLLLPLGSVGSTDKMTVSFAQVVNGVPVVGGFANVLMDATSGALLSVQSTGAPALVAASTAPAISADAATVLAERAFSDRLGLIATSASEPELVFAQVSDGGLRHAELAWELELRWDAADVMPEVWLFRIDAETGFVLDASSQVHHFDVGGTVRANATANTLPDTAGNPETQQLMRYLRVTSSAGTVFTDANGNFNYPGATGPLSCSFNFIGTFANVTNSAGAEYVLTQSLTGTANSVLMNPAPTELTTAQANAYRGIFQLRDYVRSVTPGDGTADFQALANTNISSTCNAYYDGSSVNFYQTGGGCVNTAYSTVVAHEMGHWLNVLYNTDNGSDGMGEGNADVFAMYLYDVPIVGENFCGTGCHIRTGENLRQFCGDTNPGCHGGVHNNGEVWMGAAWKVRKNLNTTHGNAMGDAIANTLFMGWMNGYNQTQIRSIIETQWLTLDDTDGNIGNGTPHYSDIDAAFRTQGFPGVDLDAIFFSNVTDHPNTPNEGGPYTIDATIVANINPPVANATLRYRVGGGAFQSVPMADLVGDLFEGNIPGQASPVFVEYYVQATDSNNLTETFPPGGATDPLGFWVGEVTVFLFNEFEGGTNEGWSTNAPGDNATTGTWTRVNPVGNDAQPEDDVTPAPGTICWVTGQHSGGGAGGNDVDGGTTTLLSPIFDAAGLPDPQISYWRWYSNDSGASPSTDVFVVDISNNGGASWVNVETVGPSGAQASGGWFQHSFAIADEIVPTNNMRLRFVASDLGSGSVVDAAIDDIEGIDIAASTFTDCNNNGINDSIDIGNGTSQDCNGNEVPDECDISGGSSDDINGNGVPDDCECLVTRYCEAAPNSVGFGSLMDNNGSVSIGQNDLVLVAADLPNGQLGVFYYGPNQIMQPFGNGFRCVGGGVFRLPVVQVNGSGVATFALDYGNPPAPGAQIEAGDIWNFQFWYRDPADGGANFNFSDGLSIHFCD